MNTDITAAALFYGGLVCLFGLVVICSDGSAVAILLGIIAAILLFAAGMKVSHV